MNEEFQMIYCDDCSAITDKNHGPQDGCIRCSRCAGATEEAPATGGLSLLDDPVSTTGSGFQSSDESLNDLDLFSSETIAQKRSRPVPNDETPLHWVTGDETADSTSESAGEAASSGDDGLEPYFPIEDSHSKQEETESWQFDCLACAGRLAVEAVVERSKLSCPRCQTWMVIDVDGEVIIPGDEFGAPQPSCSNQELEQLRKDVNRTADAILDENYGTEDFQSDFDTTLNSSFEVDNDMPDNAENYENTSSPGSVSPAALQVAEEMSSTESEVITSTEQIEITGEDSLQITDPSDISHMEVDDLDQVLEALVSEQLEENDTEIVSDPIMTLTSATVGVYTLLFAVPSMVVMSAYFAGPDSPAFQAILRMGTMVQQHGNQILDSLARTFAGF